MHFFQRNRYLPDYREILVTVSNLFLGLINFRHTNSSMMHFIGCKCCLENARLKALVQLACIVIFCFVFLCGFHGFNSNMGIGKRGRWFLGME